MTQRIEEEDGEESKKLSNRLAGRIDGDQSSQSMMIKKQTTLINTGKDAKQASGLQIQGKQKSVPEYDNIH